jgi:hypothetical protein
MTTLPFTPNLFAPEIKHLPIALHAYRTDNFCNADCPGKNMIYFPTYLFTKKILTHNL